ncbi:ubiquinone/menaquinone biosynthesis C-methylase UbiE [Desulfoprunum benzoelyticum]|uniref:Ubiquinone/menaquinone biosynthesis C-methylase UbiE n=2 Tax=Desulfoprunum benzoelyticum TaxID=1506996 RepID=A0A840V7I0_9BACT|nr:class I SAM-dependent methyltransferase [Desulfoprunum benzoelyticum]MBB5348951.1 ubiquinone/menaquinone biosynthesis C-methylase UbiE [Desulfoprunum benzoelyticum]
MESEGESHRLDVKIDAETITRQAIWAGIKPGMRVADLGCGSGKVTSLLYDLVQPGGTVVGVDGSAARLVYAQEKYGRKGIDFIQGNLTQPLGHLGQFDFIWVRFVLEYYLSKSSSMVKNFAGCLKPGGIICLVDLDHNPFNYYGIPERLEHTLKKIMKEVEEKTDFDPFIGRKLYSIVYDLGFEDIDVRVENYRVTFGKAKELEVFNMLKKIEIVPEKIKFQFDDYQGGYEEFYQETLAFLSDPRRFAYTPLILCRGSKGAKV